MNLPVLTGRETPAQIIVDTCLACLAQFYVVCSLCDHLATRCEFSCTICPVRGLNAVLMDPVWHYDNVAGEEGDSYYALL